MTEVSDAFRTALYAESSGEALVVLMTFRLTLANDATDLVRITNHPDGITSNGETFAHHPCGITLPSQSPGAAPKARLVIDNVNRTLGARLRTAVSGAVDIGIVLSSSPDTVELEWAGIEIGALKWNVQQMSIDLVRQDGRREPYPVPASTPSVTPGAF